MNFDYDVVIFGGAFSGAATALMLKRKRPDARVLIIEKAAEFDRKVGESTTDVSSCYMTRILGLTHYLGHHQLAKNGLRIRANSDVRIFKEPASYRVGKAQTGKSRRKSRKGKATNRNTITTG
jgi:2-polyprenyl-6-methoxyphenol hydroxylase-like FAD-dependent oxidoreductase